MVTLDLASFFLLLVVITLCLTVITCFVIYFGIDFTHKDQRIFVKSSKHTPNEDSKIAIDELRETLQETQEVLNDLKDDVMDLQKKKTNERTTTNPSTKTIQ